MDNHERWKCEHGSKMETKKWCIPASTDTGIGDMEYGGMI